jgi:RNase P subunit RPR2
MENQPTVESAIRRPWCPDCMKPMKYVTSASDKTDPVFRLVLFSCECGRVNDQMTASSPLR